MNADAYMETISKYAMKKKEAAVTDVTSLRMHLGMDDFQIMQLCWDLESQGTKIDYRRIEGIDTVKELADIINN